MNRFIIRIIIVSAALMMVVACKKDTAESPPEAHHEDEERVVELTDAQMKTAGIVLGAIEDKQISGTIKVNGILDVPPQQLVSISAPLGGFLRMTSLLEGTRVKRGDMIATIENLEFIQLQQDYLEAKSNYEFAKSDFERQQSLSNDNVNSEKTLQQSKVNYTSWQAKYSGLKEKLRVLRINTAAVEAGVMSSTINLYSPIDGYVTEVNVNIGKFVVPADILFEIVDTEHLHAELIIFERDVPEIQLKQKVRFTLANETKERMATVYLIGREISKDRTIQIHCHIDQEDTELLPGMYLNAVVETGSVKTPALTEESIVDYQGKKYIFIVVEDVHDDAKHGEAEGMHFEMTEISVGYTELSYTEVRSDNMEKLRSSKVVVKGAYALLSKMKNSEEEGGHQH
jgi:membrane fusion protein, heavy metal efflux system